MKILFTILFALIFSASIGQVNISGTVVDGRGGAVPGANVWIKGTYDGASSAADGKFEFETSSKGKQVLMATYVGYKDFVKEITIAQNQFEVKITLEETINELMSVTISAGAFTASDAARRTIFKAVDIASTAGATADIAGALNTLPGTQKVGESGRLFVRGGDSNETRTFIDGIAVLDAYSAAAPNTPSRGRFLPFMFKGTSFSTGGYSAEFGQALSSALVLDSKDKAESTRTDIGVLSVGGDVAHTQAWDRGSVGGKIQYTNIRPYYGLIDQGIDWIKPPASIEGVGVFRQQVGKDGIIKFYGNFNHANFALNNHDIADYSINQRYELTNDYQYMNGFFRNSIGDKWIVRGGLSYTHIQNDTRLVLDKITEDEQGIHAKTVVEGSLSERVELKGGAEIVSRDYDQGLMPASGMPSRLAFHELIAAGFTETDIHTGNNLVARLGARLEYDNLNNTLSVDPRGSLAYKTGTHSQVSLAYGKFRQSAKNSLLRVNRALGSEKATHFILNYQWMLDNRTFRIETYYKRYDNLVKYVLENPMDLANTGKGFAKGIELFWRDNHSIKNVDYWFSYSYLDTKRDYLNFPHFATPAFASAHNISLVYKHFVPALRSQLGFTYSYTTGRPYNDPNTENFDAGKTPYYADLSVNVAYLPKPFLILYASCTNLLGRDNIFGYEFTSAPDAVGTYARRAVRQAAPRFLFIGIFITLSKDKSINQLPSL